jgi:hypothetical protein
MELGYAFGYKPQPEPPTTGVYTFPDGINTVTITSDGTYFSWSSTLGIDAVLVKGGPNANLYVYDPPAESKGDADLVSPNNSNGSPAEISHIEFCYDYEVAVTKTANTSLTRTYTWEIDKSVTPATWDLFKGDSGTSEYTIAVTRNVADSNWKVTGNISILNPSPNAATITGVSDVVSDGINATVNCGVTFPYALPAGQTLNCTYTADLPNADTRTNTATVTTSGTVGGGSGSAEVNFANATVNVVGSPTINVDDTLLDSNLQFSDTGTSSYNKTFTCDANEGKTNNTATIVETGQSDSAEVMVTCYDLNVTKNANTAFTRTFNWTIDKSADQTSLLLSTGQTFLVNYTVSVNATSTDSDFGVSGSIAVANPAPMAAMINSVSDLVSPDIAASVNCGVSFPYTLAAESQLLCTYSASLPDATARTNTATATLQNYSYDADLNATPSGTTDFSGTANVAFSSTPTNSVDECITVTDSLQGDLGQVCASDTLPKKFNYTRTIGPYAVCGMYTVDNTAEFTTNDTGAKGNDSWTVDVNVPCATGCTLTPGYWKTHSKYGPAPYDDLWATNGMFTEDTKFFLSNKTYYQALWTPPAGNVYYIAAHAYIAAKLNILNGASTTPEVVAAINYLESYFAANAPTVTPTRAVRNLIVSAASTLDKYNNGLIGPGHCSE